MWALRGPRRANALMAMIPTMAGAIAVVCALLYFTVLRQRSAVAPPCFDGHVGAVSVGHGGVVEAVNRLWWAPSGRRRCRRASSPAERKDLRAAQSRAAVSIPMYRKAASWLPCMP